MRRFHGWEPRTETVYTYDLDGLLVQSTSQAEPEWDDDERGWMLALIEHRRTTCSGCGHPLDESMDPANEGRYIVPPPHRCHACTALQIAYERDTKAPNKIALRHAAHLP